MSQLMLFEDAGYRNLLPLTYWRCIAALFCGRKSLLDNAAWRLGRPISGVWTREYMAEVAGLRVQTPVNRPATDGTILVNARWLLSDRVPFHDPPYVAYCGDAIAYVSCDRKLAESLAPQTLLDSDASRELIERNPSGEIDADLLEYPWDFIARNVETLQRQWTGDDRCIDGDVSSAAYLVNHDRIHVSERSVIKPTAVIDASNGPVYISNDVLVDVHTYIEGPAYVGPGSVVKPHTALRAGTTLCSLCKVGGEISHVIMAGFSNKQHDGFLGDMYVGNWVNIGAGTTNSNLKNTYGRVSAQLGDKRVDTGQQFFGGVIGDLVRLGIGQLLPTGSMIGFGAMCAAGGVLPKFVPSFAWLTDEGQQSTDPARLLETAKTVMGRRKVEIRPEEVDLFMRLPALAAQYGV